VAAVLHRFSEAASVLDWQREPVSASCLMPSQPRLYKNERKVKMTIYFVQTEKFAKNVFSQYGEDGIIEQISKDLRIRLENAMEFGAWDGKHLSNTFARVDTLNKLILVEGDAVKFDDLKRTALEHKSIVPILAFVQPTGEQSVDNILEQVGVNELDLLSVDIDSYDLAILENLKVRPKMIVVEFNPTFGALTHYKNEEDCFVGNSFLSFYTEMAQRDYSLVAVTNTNLFFVNDEIIRKSGHELLRFSNLEILTNIEKHIFKIACGYDGSRITFGRETHPWDGSKLAKVYRYPKWVYGWEPTYAQLAYRSLRTLKIREIISGLKRAREKGWFKWHSIRD
jgi:hypothetical protein